MEDDDTLEALMDQLGIGASRRSDPFAAQRDRYTHRPPAIDPNSMQSVAGQVAPTVRREDLRPLPTRQEQERDYARLQQSPREAPAYQAPMNQFADAGNQGLEMTGLPSVRRSAAAFADNRPREGFEEGAMGALSLATLGVGGRSAMPGRAPMRAPMAEPVPRPGALRPPVRNPMRPEMPPIEARPAVAPDAVPSSGGGARVQDGANGREVVVTAPDGRELRFPLQVVDGEVSFAQPPTLPTNLRGQRLGSEIIRAAVDDAHARGLTFTGGGMVSPDGMRLADSLERAGYRVERNADLYPDPIDGYISPRDGNSAVFTVPPGRRPNAPDGSPSPAGARLSPRDRERQRTFRSQGGVVRYRDTGDAWAISETDLPPHLWNQGLGGQMYRDFIEAARAAGRSRIESDVRLTPQAERVYESLRRRGYDVQRNEDGVFVVSTNAPARGPSQ